VYINTKERNIYLFKFEILEAPSPHSAILFLRTDITYFS